MKRDGKKAAFDIAKITAAIQKAFQATGTSIHPSVIDLLALRVTADFDSKIKNNAVQVEDIQDSVESILIQSGYHEVAKAYILYRKQREYRQASENSYNMAFYELVDYVQNVETYLAKSLISTTPEHGAETLTNLWREANLAQSYLSMLPVQSQELENTEKFLNQVSDYSYSLSRKNIYNEPLTQEDLDNLTNLHKYSVELKNTLVQLSADMNEGRISWGELTKKGSVAFSASVIPIAWKSRFWKSRNNELICWIP